MSHIRMAAGLAVGILAVSGCGVAQASTIPPVVQGTPSSLNTRAQWIPAPKVAQVASHLIAGARHSIRLEMYELGNPTLVQALIAAHQRGISVQVVLDPTENQSQQTGPVLARAGIPVRWMHVPHGIDHVKLLIIDGHEVLTGGVNWGRYSQWTTDADVLLASDPLAAQIFQADWQSAGGHPTVDPEGPGGLTGAAIQPALDQMIASAHRSIDVAANYLSDWNIQDALIAAHNRGVQVHVLLNKDTPEALSTERWLVKHGLTVRWATGPYLHAKVLLVDGKTGMLGSANFSYHGMAINHEFDVSLSNAVLPQAMQWFSGLWTRGRTA